MSSLVRGIMPRVSPSPPCAKCDTNSKTTWTRAEEIRDVNKMIYEEGTKDMIAKAWTKEEVFIDWLPHSVIEHSILSFSK